jgi:hypothetical protein
MLKQDGCRQCGVSLRYLPASWRYCSQHCRDAADEAKQLAREAQRLEREAQRYEKRIARNEERYLRRLDASAVKVRREHEQSLMRPTIPYKIATANPYGRMKRPPS